VSSAGKKQSLSEMKEWTDNKVTLLGNIPPRDVLAGGTAEDVKVAARESLSSIEYQKRVILSCGGGMPPNVSTENITAFKEEILRSRRRLRLCRATEGAEIRREKC
jgi:uroporphyrinogen-III decarboxylase